jgi:hypothetical protein
MVTRDVAARQSLRRRSAKRALASHRLPKGDLASLMKLVLETFVQHEEKRRFAVGRKPRTARGDAKPVGASATPPGKASTPPTGTSSTPLGGASALPTGRSSTPPGGPSALPASRPRKVTLLARFWRGRKRSRYISALVTRSAYLRDQGQCAFVSADGRRCGARAFLQLDHIEPWATLGASVTENVRILCRGHNQLHARHCSAPSRLLQRSRLGTPTPTTSERRSDPITITRSPKAADQQE